MAHAAKYGKGAMGHILAHYDRSKECDDNVDAERTHLNYNLANHQKLTQLEFIHRRLSEVRVLNRKDVNVLCDWIVTIPKDFLEEHPEKEEDFFRATYQFLEKKYGKENVVSAWVHRDETTPHIHFAFVPVVADKKHGGEKLSAKECLTRAALRTFHTELEQHVSQELRLEVHILNEATKDGNKTVTELKRETEIEKQQLLARETAVMEGRLLVARDHAAMAVSEREDAEQQLLRVEQKLLQQREELVQVNEQLADAKEFLNQIPDWPAYNEEATHAFNLVDAFRKLLQDTFGRGGIFRNRKAERAILKAVEGLRDMIMVSVSALRGFEIRERVPKPQQRSEVIVRSLEETLTDATARSGSRAIDYQHNRSLEQKDL